MKLISLEELFEWQLSNYHYSTVVKMLDEREQTPPQLKRCVTAVAKQHGGDVSRAFAICTGSLQKKGYLEKGTQRPTKKGKKRGRSKAAEKSHVKKLSDYEELLAMARKGPRR
jgi:hypothetical protein